VTVLPNACFEAPAEGQYPQGQEPLEAFVVTPVSVFEIETSGFETTE